MSKVTRYNSAQVIIELETRDGRAVSYSGAGRRERTWKKGDADSGNNALDRAEDIRKAIIKALGDYVDSVNAAYTKLETEPVCEFCGAKWTEDDDEYNGGCCKAEMDRIAEVLR